MYSNYCTVSSEIKQTHVSLFHMRLNMRCIIVQLTWQLVVQINKQRYVQHITSPALAWPTTF